VTSHGTIGRIAAVHRYPVKSLSGETLRDARFDARGVAGDRCWAVLDPDGKLGSGKSTRRFRRMPGLLELTAEYDGDVPVVTFPDGRRLRPGPELDEALSWHVGRRVTLGRESEVSHFDDGPVHLVTTSAVRAVEEVHGAAVDARRFRANLLLDDGTGAGYAEDGWLGARLTVGEAVLEVVQPMPRCVMVDQHQVGVDVDGGRLLRTVATHRDNDFGLLLRVVRTGRFGVGNDVVVQPPAIR
jgi:uncharacterized protein